MAKISAHIEMEVSDEVIKNFSINLITPEKVKDIEELSIEVDFKDFGGIVYLDTETEKSTKQEE